MDYSFMRKTSQYPPPSPPPPSLTDVTEEDLELLVLLPLPPGCLDRCMLPCLAYVALGMKHSFMHGGQLLAVILFVVFGI